MVGIAGSLRGLPLQLGPEARLAEQLRGTLGGISVQGEDEGGALGVGVTDVEVEDVYTVRAHEGGDLGEDTGAVLDGDGYLDALSVRDLTPKLRHRPGERPQGFT